MPCPRELSIDPTKGINQPVGGAVGNSRHAYPFDPHSPRETVDTLRPQRYGSRCGQGAMKDAPSLKGSDDRIIDRNNNLMR